MRAEGLVVDAWMVPYTRWPVSAAWSGLEGLLVAHLAHQHDVRFSHQGAEAILKSRQSMPISRWLIVAFLSGEDVLDRVLDRHDVHGLALVHVVEHRGDRGRLCPSPSRRRAARCPGLHGDVPP